jgi:hypothetical protein
MARIRHTIVEAVTAVKERGGQLPTPQLVFELCCTLGHRWRRGPLDPFNTIIVFLIQILHGNTACAHACLLSGLGVTDSAYCQARRRLPLRLFATLFARLVDDLLRFTAGASSWRGHRVFLLDGSSFSMPDTPALQKHFGQPSGQKKGCGFPMSHLMALCDLGTGLVIDLIASPLYSGDLTKGVRTHRLLREGDVVLGDRVFGTWGYMALVLQHNLHAVARAHQRLKLNFNPRQRWHERGTYCRLYKLGRDDQVIEWFKPPRRPKWMSLAVYERLSPSIVVRAIRYTIRRKGFRTKHVTLLTTLTDHARYPADELAALYRRRWEIETNFRDLKETMGMKTLRCRTVDGVLKEMYTYAIAYNLVRMACVKAGTRQGVDARRISFIDALRSLQQVLVLRCAGEPPPRLMVNPHRPGRAEPRLVKRRPPQRRYLTIPRVEARKRLQQQTLAA